MSEYINNRESRKEVLKEIILELHNGKRVEDVKERFNQLVRNVDATEIAQMEQALISEGLAAEEIKRLCDVHTAVFMEALEEKTEPQGIPGHPVHTFRKENRAIEELISSKIRPGLQKLADNGFSGDAVPSLRLSLNQLMNIDKHYSRKENLLFPYLEKYGVAGPTTVMWGIQDDIRGKLKDALKKLGSLDSREGISSFREEVNEICTMVESMIYKEEKILLPMALELLTEDEWARIARQSGEIGYCLAEPDNLWRPGKAEPKAEKEKSLGYEPQGFLKLDTGVLTMKEVNLILKHLPIDISFVDRDDNVKYFSQTRERIFLRSESIIGRKVQNCHPPASVHAVQEIVDDFKAGKRDTADFWIQMKGRFVFIRYIAVRDENGMYAGTLEVTQDIGRLKELEGEKRLDTPVQ